MTLNMFVQVGKLFKKFSCKDIQLFLLSTGIGRKCRRAEGEIWLGRDKGLALLAQKGTVERERGDVAHRSKPEYVLNSPFL